MEKDIFDGSFLKFMDHRILYLRECKRIGTSNNYRRAKSSVERFLDGKDLKFCELDSRWVDDYADWLMKRGMVRNSASFHMRILRAVYNKGVKKGLAVQSYPFRETYTGIDRTGKRCVAPDIIASLRALDLEKSGRLRLARDMFLFSVYTRGMSFIDMVFLRKTDLEGEALIYRRKKTGGLLKIRIEAEMREIIMRYREVNPDSLFIFPVLKGNEPERHYEEYLKALGRYNYRLRQLSGMLGLNHGLTSYVSRHTWASIAYKMEIPLAVISSGMGHRSETVTKIYLESLDNSAIDRANRLVLSSLRL